MDEAVPEREAGLEKEDDPEEDEEERQPAGEEGTLADAELAAAEDPGALSFLSYTLSVCC